MAAKVLPPGSGGSFLDSPVFSHTLTQPSPLGFSATDASPPLTKLFFDSSDTEGVSSTPYMVTSQLNTPDSGFCGAAVSTPMNSPGSEFSTNVATPTSSGNSHRKRKTVTINESQPTVVVISPDDLFKAYSRPQSERENLQHVTYDPEFELPSEVGQADLSDTIDYHLDSITGWPIKRSDSLESRDNPFMPGGELSRQAEDLLSQATIIRDQFYLHENEKRALQEQQQQQCEQQLQQQQVVKHGEIVDNLYGFVHCQTTSAHSPSSPGPSELMEEKLLLQSSSSSPLLGAASPNGGDSCQLQATENGKVEDSPDAVTLSTQGADNHPAEGAAAHMLDDLQVHDSNTKQRNKCCCMM